jgi:hypothetical protein
MHVILTAQQNITMKIGKQSVFWLILLSKYEYPTVWLHGAIQLTPASHPCLCRKAFVQLCAKHIQCSEFSLSQAGIDSGFPAFTFAAWHYTACMIGGACHFDRTAQHNNENWQTISLLADFFCQNMSTYCLARGSYTANTCIQPTFVQLCGKPIQCSEFSLFFVVNEAFGECSPGLSPTAPIDKSTRLRQSSSNYK